ncbi:MAG: DUF3048 domain-containing protein [Candidatus Portnoybacteria bacterium]|nr:DUF3048 domain-containing protein [Candidatus Portnoybacteria bacterium]
MRKKRFKQVVFGLFFLALAGGLFLTWQIRRGVELKKSGQADEFKNQEAVNGSSSPLSGLVCKNADRRPIAVMLSGDAVTRPLSGIGEADMVFEMAVTEGGITRLMAIFVCNEPTRLGSVRSARHDFIPLALGLDAVYAHWGGSHFALDKLKTGIIDNLDALPNPFNAFYRQSGIAAPHNGFTSTTRILAAIEKMDWRQETNFSGYPHLSNEEISSHGSEKMILTVNYPSPFKVSYEYDPVVNSYFRYRDNLKEIDKNTGKQVEAKNVIIMRALSQPLEDQYNDVQVEGEGKAEFYLNGRFETGKWVKDRKDQKSKLFFYNEKDKEIKFVPGAVWIQIVGPEAKVGWQ